MMRFFCHRKNKDSNGGFSLVEVLVAIVIFSVVMLIAIGALVSIIDLNKKARSQKQALNNLNSALESMTRTIRDGTNYYCDYSANPATYDFEKDISAGNPCPLGPPDANVFVFDSFLTRTAYFEFGGQIMRYKTGEGSVAMTAPDVSIEDLSFRTIVYTDSVTIPTAQPNVLITVRGRAGINNPVTETDFSLQSTVSERLHPASSGGGTPAPSDNPHCTFPKKSGRYIVNFEAEKFIANSWKYLLCCMSPVQKLTYTLNGLNDNGDPDSNRNPIPAGTYDVRFATFDNHWNSQRGDWGCNELGSDESTCLGDSSHAQPLEHMKMILRNGGVDIGAVFVGGDPVSQFITLGDENGVSQDVPWNSNDHTTNIGRVTGIPIIDSIVIEHAVTATDQNNYNVLYNPDTNYESVVAACAAFDVVGGGVDVEIREF
jgi:prepilin-type N-terminal cleavage/methylation domain-containing protein